MKILFVQEYYYPYIGGVETLFKELAEKLVEKGHQVYVITSKYDKSLPEYETLNGVEIRRINTRNRIIFGVKAIFPVYKSARKLDIIQTTTYSAALPAVIGGFLSKKKVVITIHEYWGKLWFKLPFLSSINRIANYILEFLVLNFPYSKIVAVSEATKESLIKNKVDFSKIVRIYNGLDYKQFKGLSHQIPDQFVFTYYCRLGVSKGLDILIEGAVSFLKQNANSKLRLIIPTTPAKFYNRIISMVDKSKLNGQIEILSNLKKDHLYQEVCASNCVVIPSYSEGFCFVAAEAVAMGIPVISSDKGALKEVVGGKFIKMKDHTSAGLHEALSKAHKEQWDYSEPKEYYLNSQVNEYVNLYKEVLSN